MGWRKSSGSYHLIISGKAEVIVPLGYKPKEVWLNLWNNSSVSDGFDVQITETGFVIVVDQHNDIREIHWIAR